MTTMYYRLGVVFTMQPLANQLGIHKSNGYVLLSLYLWHVLQSNYVCDGPDSDVELLLST
jgi:hypothetical protein